jgi:two-component system sensor histidine kinase/response regulator
MTDARTLIVDDDPALLDALSETLRLRMEGLAVEVSDSAGAALEQIATTDYDAIVADIKMPGMDGLELLGEIKKIQPDTPTLLITGHGDHDLAVQALRGGAYDYVTKPIDREYFVTSLRRAIECHRLSHDVTRQKLELERRAKELEECVTDRTHELRELFHREHIARAELDAANRKLEEANHQRERFISMIAHDLGGPLTAMLGYAEILGRSEVPPGRQERAREVIVSETRRMARLVGDLADAAHLASGQFEIRSVTCDLTGIAREQVELARPRTERHTIRLDAPADLPVPCDRDRIAQLLSNLLANALKYTPQGEIRVRVWQEGREARLSVSDEGPGIPPDRAEAIFEAGHRLGNGQADQKSNGVGLGLHIARGIVEAHGGRIWVESVPGEGATFQVALPMVLAEPAGASDDVLAADS